ncbi:unnamed protein product [Symbiodinium natans]|uniref:Ubiquitin-like domain-containing protein n=1 Tax=Symbiodinium natans TaxID=878477 RepID=A0A812TJJ2_9DINO|nr:unnamed protein product [Symbiodinium natans]
MGAMMGSAKKPAPLGGLHLQHLSSLWTGQHGHSSENRDAELCIQFLLLSGQQLCLQFRRDATVQAARHHIALICCLPSQAVQLLYAGDLLQEEVHLSSLGEDSVQVIFNASCLHKGPGVQLAELGVWHGLKVRSLLLNPVAAESRGVLRQSCGLRGHRMSCFYTAKDADGSHTLVSARRKGHATCRQFTLGIEGLDLYCGRIYRSSGDKEYLLCDGWGGLGLSGHRKVLHSAMLQGEAREMGLLRFKSKRRVGLLHVEFVLPRMTPASRTQDGLKSAPLPQSILQLYHERKLDNLQILPGTADERNVELLLKGERIFEAWVSDASHWEVKFGPPLSHFQALGIMTAVLDNASSAIFHK